MRAFLLTAVIAASAIAASLAVADAATSIRSYDMNKARVEGTAWAGHDDFVQDLAPSRWFGNSNPRLSNIEQQLDRAERRISADQRHGLMTAGEARAAREQDRLIRNTAFDAVRQNHGSIPDTSYTALLGRVAGLNQTIQMDTQHG